MTKSVAELRVELEEAKAREQEEKREKRRAAQKAEHQKVLAFRADLEKIHSVDDLAQKSRDAMWNKAWERGHSSGFHEVELEYVELIELISTVLEAERNQPNA